MLLEIKHREFLLPKGKTMKHLIRIICVAVTLFLIIGCSSSDNGAKSENQTTTVSGNMTVKVEPENKVDSPKKPIILNASMILIGKALPREERETTENVKADAKGKRIPLPAGKNTRTDEEMAKIADKVIMKLKQGADFGAVARAYSDHSSGLYGGRLGNIAVEKFTPELLAEIQKLKVGEFSKMPVKTPVGLVIYRRDKAEQTVNLSALLIVIGHTGSPNKLKGATRDQKEALDLAKELTDKIKNGADFATLAKKYSDHSTGALGGDIGVIKSNQLPPAVAKELKNLKIGQVTPTPFDSPMGYHIMQRKNRRGISISPLPSFWFHTEIPFPLPIKIKEQQKKRRHWPKTSSRSSNPGRISPS
jgi:hypothetical protein